LDDWTALHMASNNGHYKVVEVLLNNEANIEAKTTMSRTPLHISCLRGYFEIVKLLVDSGASINSTDNDFNTPLHYISEHGYPEILKFLLDKGPEITIKNHAGLTCIDVANNVEIRKIFEERDLINENTVNSFGRTSIGDFVLYNGRADIVGKLLYMGNFNAK
jgi:ankyrin repeat protein